MSNFADHAANERTFLAWLRTGIAVVAFGFVLEKFNLFVSALENTNSEIGKVLRIDRLTGPLGRYEGVVLMVTGLVLMLVGYGRFRQEEHVLSQGEMAGVKFRHSVELMVTVVLVFLVAAYCIAILAR